MATETPAELTEADRLKIDREALTRAVSAQPFDGITGINVLVKLQNTLLSSSLSPQLSFHELSISSGQLLTRAQDSGQDAAAEILKNMDEGFKLAHRDLSPSQPDVSKASTPTRTARLPMTDAKGMVSQPKPPEKPANTTPDSPKPLTQREAEIVEALKNAKDKTTEDVARELGIKPQSLRTQVSILKGKGINIESVRADGSKISGFYVPEENLSSQATDQPAS